MAPIKAKEDKKRKSHQSKDYNAFLVVLPMVDNDINKARDIVAKLRSEGVF